MKNARLLGSLFRNVRTRQERAMNILHRQEGIKIRSKRYGENLPNSYHDIHYSRTTSKSWKDLYKKKKQYNNKHLKPHAFVPWDMREFDLTFECPSKEKFVGEFRCFYECPFYLTEYKYCLKYEAQQNPKPRKSWRYSWK